MTGFITFVKEAEKGMYLQLRIFDKLPFMVFVYTCKFNIFLLLSKPLDTSYDSVLLTMSDISEIKSKLIV